MADVCVTYTLVNGRQCAGVFEDVDAEMIEENVHRFLQAPDNTTTVDFATGRCVLHSRHVMYVDIEPMPAGEKAEG